MAAILIAIAMYEYLIGVSSGVKSCIQIPIATAKETTVKDWKTVPDIF